MTTLCTGSNYTAITFGCCIRSIDNIALGKDSSVVQQDDQEEMSRTPLKYRIIDLCAVSDDAQLKECIAKRS